MQTFREWLREPKCTEENINESSNTQKLNAKTMSKIFEMNPEINKEFNDLTGSVVKQSKVVELNKSIMIVKFKDKISCFDKENSTDTSIYFNTSKL